MRLETPIGPVRPQAVEDPCRGPRPSAVRRRVVLSLCVATITITAVAAAQPEKRVTARVAGQTLAEALPLVGRSAGVELRAGPNAAGIRWFLFLRDERLSVVRRQLQEFLPTPPGKALWYAQGPVQILDEDLASRNARRNAAARRRTFAYNHRRQGVARTLERPKQGARDPRQRSAQAILCATIFSGFPRAAQELAYAGRPVSVPYSALTPKSQDLVRQRVKGESAGVIGRPEFSFHGATDYPQVVVEVWSSGTPATPGLCVWLRGGRSGNGPMFPDIVNAPTWTKGKGSDHGYDPYLKRARRPERASESPHLQQRVTLEGGRDWIIEKVLDELFAAAGLPILGDYDPLRLTRSSGQQTLLKGKITNVPIWKALDVIAEQFDLDWDIRDRWILIRSPRTVLGWSGELDLSPPQRPAASLTPAHR